jgi:hypothetical protein
MLPERSNPTLVIIFHQVECSIANTQCLETHNFNCYYCYYDIVVVRANTKPRFHVDYSRTDWCCQNHICSFRRLMMCLVPGETRPFGVPLTENIQHIHLAHRLRFEIQTNNIVTNHFGNTLEKDSTFLVIHWSIQYSKEKLTCCLNR